MPYPRGSHSSPCGKRMFTGFTRGGTIKVYFRAEHCRAEHFRGDGMEAGGAVGAGSSPQNRPGIPKHNRTRKTVIAYEGSCGLFLSGKTKGEATWNEQSEQVDPSQLLQHLPGGAPVRIRGYHRLRAGRTTQEHAPSHPVR